MLLVQTPTKTSIPNNSVSPNTLLTQFYIDVEIITHTDLQSTVQLDFHFNFNEFL